MAPLPMYAGDVAERRSARVHRYSWSERPGMGLGPQIVDWVRGEVTAALDGVDGSPLLIGKSLGTLAAAVAADRSLPAVWLTPLLSEPWAVDLYARANAPFLLVGGTADPYWDSAMARRLSPHVLEVDGANHGNGFANTGLLDDDARTPFPAEAKVTFAKAGSYAYICTVHGPSMKGTVEVS